jgi:hypothetical protein
MVAAAGEFAKVFQREGYRAGGKIGGKAPRFKQHFGRHLSGQALHRLAEDSEGGAGFAKVGGKRQTVRAGTDNCCMYKIRSAVHVRVDPFFSSGD